MKQKGFGLIVLIIAIAIIILIAGGGIYFTKIGQQSAIEQGNDAVEHAEEAVKLLEDLNKKAGEELLR